ADLNAAAGPAEAARGVRPGVRLHVPRREAAAHVPAGIAGGDGAGGPQRCGGGHRELQERAAVDPACHATFPLCTAEKVPTSDCMEGLVSAPETKRTSFGPPQFQAGTRCVPVISVTACAEPAAAGAAGGARPGRKHYADDRVGGGG